MHDSSWTAKPRAAREWTIRLALILAPLLLVELAARLLVGGADLAGADAAVQTLRFGTGMEASGLIEGWGFIEPDWVWITAPTATLAFQDLHPQPLQVRAEIMPMRSLDGRPQTMSVVLNGTRVAERSLSREGFQRCWFSLPGAALRRGDNLLRFDFRYAVTPAQAGIGPDQRTLAAAFRELEFSRPILPLPSHLTRNETYRALARYEAVRNSPDVFELDSELLWRLRPGATPRFGGPINRRGWRGPEVEPRRPGTLRVVCLGDSRTFGTYIDFQEVWTTRLAGELETALRQPVEVINTGTPGYSSHQGRLLLGRVLRELKPDAVTLYFGMNDLASTTGAPDHLQAGAEPWLRSVSAALEASRAYRLLQRWLDPSPPSQREARPRVPLDRFQSNLRESIEQCRARRVGVVLLYSSIDPGSIHMLGGLRPQVRAQRRLLGELAAESGAALLDLDRRVAETNEIDFFRIKANDASHPSPRGNALISRWLTPLLAGQLRAHHAGPAAPSER